VVGPGGPDPARPGAAALLCTAGATVAPAPRDPPVGRGRANHRAGLADRGAKRTTNRLRQRLHRPLAIVRVLSGEDQPESRDTAAFTFRLQDVSQSVPFGLRPAVGGSSSRTGCRRLWSMGHRPDAAAGVTESRRPALTCSSMAKSSWTAQCSTTFWSSIRNTCRLVARPRASTTAAAEYRGRLRGSRA
jgi:hypothetical protein